MNAFQIGTISSRPIDASKCLNQTTHLESWQTSLTISKVFIWLIGAVCLRLVCSSNRFVYTFDFFTPESGQFGAMLDLAFAFSSRKFLVETSLEVRAECGSVEQSV